MKIRSVEQADLEELYRYWRHTGKDIPFFFTVDRVTWQSCLLAEPRGMEGLRLVPDQTGLYLAEEQAHVVGFVQYGVPNFTWDEQGQKVERPNVGIIRHLYFQPESASAGQALLARAIQDLTGKRRIHAFYHAHGMSCNAHHGKLHESMGHVRNLLTAEGFAVEHKNIYFTLDMGIAPSSPSGVDLQVERSTPHGITRDSITAFLNGKPVGSAVVTPLAELTGSAAQGALYLYWIGITHELQGQGVGSRFMQSLIGHYRDQGGRRLHTDTVDSNARAQRFYLRNGFVNRGVTRSFVRTFEQGQSLDRR